jgi:ATP synthase protein I
MTDNNNNDTGEELATLKKQIAHAEKQRRGKKEAPDSSVAEASKAMSEVWQILLEFMVPIAVGTGIGYWLDGYFDTAPWLLLIFLLLGMGAGFTSLYRRANGYHPWRVGYRKK